MSQRLRFTSQIKNRGDQIFDSIAKSLELKTKEVTFVGIHNPRAGSHLICCVFPPALGCCVHPKECQNTFLSVFNLFCSFQMFFSDFSSEINVVIRYVCMYPLGGRDIQYRAANSRSRYTTPFNKIKSNVQHLNNPKIPMILVIKNVIAVFKIIS